MTSSDIRAALLDEYLELEERVNPLEKRLSQVRDQLRDIVTEEGHFVDELRGVGVHVEARFRKEYDPDRLAGAVPQLAARIRPAGGLAQLGARGAGGVGTEKELGGGGGVFRNLPLRGPVG